MSLITARGQEVEQSINQKKVDLKSVFIRLKEGDSVKVRVLGIHDYVEYKAHGSFAHKIYTQPCIEPLGKECPLCVASKSGEEGYDVLYAKKRYLMAFADLDKGELRVLDLTKGQAKKLIAQIKEYADDINDIAFNLKRTGTKTETAISLNPILKLKGDDVEKFAKFDDMAVEDSFFESVLVPRSEQMMMGVLKESGFPVIEFFPDYVEEVSEGEAQENGEVVF